MKVLFVNNGHLPRPTNGAARATASGDWRRYVPRSVKELIKPYVIAMPAALQRRTIGGFGIEEVRFPLGLGFLASMLKQRGHAVDLVDRFADSGAWIENVNEYDFVGVYASTPFFDDCLEVLRLLEESNYRGPIAFGGPHTTAYPNTIPPRVDYVVQGEAEYIICDLVEGRYRSGSLIRTSRIEDLDSLPRPDFDLFLNKKRGYRFDFEFSDRTPIFNLNTSRSCPYNCSFCGVRDVWGRLWRAQSAERILDDILFLKREYDIAGVYFREDLFTGDKRRVRELSELLIKHNANIVWACETRVDTGADRELVSLMAKSGCRGFYIGAESGSQRMLDHYVKGIQAEDIYRTCAHAKTFGIAVYMSLIVAHPEETMRDKLDTLRLVRTTKPEMYGLSPFRSEYTRHGVVSYEEYPERPVITEQTVNSTWRGQRDRFDFLQVEEVERPSAKLRSLPVVASGTRESRPPAAEPGQ